MLSLLRPLLWTALLLAYPVDAANALGQVADVGPVAPEGTAMLEPSPADMARFATAQQLARTTDLWDRPLDWKETRASLTEIAEHARKALGKDAPLIEVRGKDTSHSTFALKKAWLGPTLVALGELANFKVWVFPGRLVLCPESALTAKEKAAVEQRDGGEWRESYSAGGDHWGGAQGLNDIGVYIVGSEIKRRLAAKGITTVPPATAAHQLSDETLPSLYELSFAELSPTSQNVLIEMVKFRGMGASTPTASCIVGYNDTRQNYTELRLQKPALEDPGKREPIGQWQALKPVKIKAPQPQAH